MKIALFSDVHGNLEALTAVLKAIKEEQVDKVICLGDVIAIGPNSKECLDLIIDNNITLILGNHEIYYLYGAKNVDSNMSEGELEHQAFINNQLSEYHYNFLKKCPLDIKINYKDKKILLTHFLIENKNKILPFYPLSILKQDYDDIVESFTADYIFIGHKHAAFKEQINDTLLIDIGSCGTRRDDTTTYHILDIKNDITIEEKTITYDRELFLDTMSNIEYPEKEFISRVFFGIR